MSAEGREMNDPTPERPEPIDQACPREEVRKKVNAWIATQPEPRPTRSEAIERLLAREAAARAIPSRDLNASNDE